MSGQPSRPSSDAPPPAKLDDARRAKERFAADYRTAGWCRGYGIAPRGDGFVLRVNVAPVTEATVVPRVIEGVPVVAVEMDGYTPR